MKRITTADYISIANQRGFAWIGDYPKHTSLKTRWRCSKGHEWDMRYADVRRGHGCPFCFQQRRRLTRRLQVSDYIELAFSRGFDWIGIEIPNARTKTRWKCSKGHEWEAPHYAIKAGNGCPHCDAIRQRESPYHIRKREQYEILAQERGYEFLGIIRAGKTLKGRWKCPLNHEWIASYTRINDGRGCPKCATFRRNDNRRILPEQYHQLAQVRGFEWIGEWTGATYRKTRWRCQNGHEWDSTYSHIAGNRGCPFCVDIINGHKVSKPQRMLHKILGGELNYRVGRYAIDVALCVNGTNIAVEYDCWYWHKGQRLKEKRRDAFLIRRGWRILHIRTNLEFPSLEQLDDAISRLLNGANTVNIVLDWGRH